MSRVASNDRKDGQQVSQTNISSPTVVKYCMGITAVQEEIYYSDKPPLLGGQVKRINLKKLIREKLGNIAWTQAVWIDQKDVAAKKFNVSGYTAKCPVNSFYKAMTINAHINKNMLALADMNPYGQGVFGNIDWAMEINLLYAGDAVLLHFDDFSIRRQKHQDEDCYAIQIPNYTNRYEGFVTGFKRRNFASYIQWGPNQEFLNQFYYFPKENSKDQEDEKLKHDVELATAKPAFQLYDDMPIPLVYYAISGLRKGRQVLIDLPFDFWKFQSFAPALFNIQGASIDPKLFFGPIYVHVIDEASGIKEDILLSGKKQFEYLTEKSLDPVIKLEGNNKIFEVPREAFMEVLQAVRQKNSVWVAIKGNSIVSKPAPEKRSSPLEQKAAELGVELRKAAIDPRIDFFAFNDCVNQSLWAKHINIAGKESEMTALHRAIGCNASEKVALLLESGADINMSIKGKKIPQIMAEMKKPLCQLDEGLRRELDPETATLKRDDLGYQLRIAAADNSVGVEAFQVMLTKAVELNIVNSAGPLTGLTALHRAVLAGNTQKIEFLLAAKADVTLKVKNKSSYEIAIDQSSARMLPVELIARLNPAPCASGELTTDFMVPGSPSEADDAVLMQALKKIIARAERESLNFIKAKKTIIATIQWAPLFIECKEQLCPIIEKASEEAFFDDKFCVQALKEFLPPQDPTLSILSKGLGAIIQRAVTEDRNFEKFIGLLIQYIDKDARFPKILLSLLKEANSETLPKILDHYSVCPHVVVGLVEVAALTPTSTSAPSEAGSVSEAQRLIGGPNVFATANGNRSPDLQLVTLGNVMAP